MNLNKDNTIYIGCSRTNDDVKYLDIYYQAKALGIEAHNIFLEDFSVIDNYDNIIFSNYQLIYFGGVVNDVERATIEFLEYVHEKKKNLYIFIDITYDSMYHVSKGLKLLNHPQIELQYKTVSQLEFPTTIARTFCDITPMKTNPTMGLFYGMGVRAGRIPKLNKYIYCGDSNFYLCGAGCEKYKPNDTKVNFLSKRRIPYSKYMNYLNDSYCTVLLQDIDWINTESKMPSWRHYEAWSQNCVCFIDNDMDPTHQWLNGDDFFYISDYSDFYNKIQQIMTNPELRKEKLSKQIEALNKIDKQQYSIDFWKYLNSL